MRLDGRLYVTRLETTVLKKTHLPGLLLEFLWQFRTEFLAPDPICQVEPVFGNVIEDFINQARGKASITEFLADANGTLALVDARLCKIFDEATIVLQALAGQLLYCRRYDHRLEAGCREFPFEFLLAVNEANP